MNGQINMIIVLISIALDRNYIVLAQGGASSRVSDEGIFGIFGIR